MAKYCRFVAIPILVTYLTLTVSSLQAETVYFLRSYPSEQDGSFMRGKIVVAEDAAEDGLLSEAEINEWQWNITKDRSERGVTSFHRGAFVDIQGEIGITADGIVLADPFGPGSVNEIVFCSSRCTTNPDEPSQLGYGKYLVPPGEPGEGEVATYFDGGTFGDTSYCDSCDYWHTQPTPDALGGNPWVIASAVLVVPEPYALTYLEAAAALVLLSVGQSRRRRRICPRH